MLDCHFHLLIPNIPGRSVTSMGVILYIVLFDKLYVYFKKKITFNHDGIIRHHLQFWLYQCIKCFEIAMANRWN